MAEARGATATAHHARTEELQAFCARPARPGLDSLRRILPLIVPPAIACAALGLPLYVAYATATDIGRARTVFTTFAVVCGLGLVPLLEPPIGESMSGADADGADIRPTIVALALLGLYRLFFVVAPVREFFELVPLPWIDLVFIGILVVLWALLVMTMWCTSLVDRLSATLARGDGQQTAQPAPQRS